LTKGDLSQSLLQHDEEINSRRESNLEKSIESRASTIESEEFVTPTCFSNNFQVTDLDDSDTDEAIKDDNRFAQNNLINMNSWNNTLDTVLEQKAVDFNSYSTPSPIHKLDGANEETITPSPQSRAEYSTEDAEDEFSNAEDLPG
jgi:hypothetical protein